MIANQEFSFNQVSTLTYTSSIDKKDLALKTPTSISLTPPNNNSDAETDEEIETDDNDLALETPTSISLTPPNNNSDAETDEEIETDDNDLALETPLKIESVLTEDTSDSVIENQDAQITATEVEDVESPIPISLSALPVELTAPETAAVKVASNNTSLSVGEFTAASGGKVTVEIAIDNATDLQSLDLDVYYDTELLDIPDPIPETEINEGVSRTGIVADWQWIAESGDNPEAEIANPIVNVVEDIGDGKTGKIDINLINTSETPISGSGKIIAIDFEVSEDVPSKSIAKIDLQQAELGINGQTFNLGDSDSLLQDGSVIVGVDSIDLDDNGSATPLNDGILILRHLFGAESKGLTNSAIGSGATRIFPADIKFYLNQIESSLDIDRNGSATPLNDGILIVRRLFGAEGEGLTNGAIGSGARSEFFPQT